MDPNSPTDDTTGPRPQVELDDRVSGAFVAGRYRLIERIADGAMGRVYLAEHEGLHRRVALKFLHDELAGNQEVAARFAREAVAAARLEHPNVIAVYDSGTDERGRCFLAMEYCDGEELRALLTRQGRLLRAHALHLARQVAAALDHAHSLGIVHRDIKPENVLVQRRDEGDDLVKVIDFGIAKVYLPDGPSGQALTRTGIVLGTPEYMAPEQALGAHIDHRADLYSFALTVYEMLVGRRPFDDDDIMVVIMQQVHGTPPPPSSLCPEAQLPTAVDEVFATALAKSPSDRYSSAARFITALERALASTEPAPPIVKPTVPAEIAPKAPTPRDVLQASLERARDRWQRASPRGRAAVVAGALVGVLGLVAVASHRRAPTPITEVTPEVRPTPVPVTAPAVAAELRARIEAVMAESQLVGGTARERSRATLALDARHTHNPDDTAVAYVLGVAYARERSTWPQSLVAYREALRTAPELARDERLLDDVVHIYAASSSPLVPAEALLRGALAEGSLSRLVDVALRGTSGYARVATLLAEAPFAERLDPTQRAVVELSLARTCETKRAAIDALGRRGDARALPALRRIPTGSGCGFLGLARCNACLGAAVPAAIRAITARSADAG